MNRCGGEGGGRGKVKNLREVIPSGG